MLSAEVQAYEFQEGRHLGEPGPGERADDAGVSRTAGVQLLDGDAVGEPGHSFGDLFVEMELLLQVAVIVKRTASAPCTTSIGKWPAAIMSTAPPSTSQRVFRKLAAVLSVFVSFQTGTAVVS